MSRKEGAIHGAATGDVACDHYHRFGLVHVDFATQRRTIKDSGHWYRRVIESHGATLQD